MLRLFCTAVTVTTYTLFALSCCLANDRPLIIAHRGSPCSIPEETIEGFQAAASAGADYLEMDVVMSKDGTLICRHDVTLDDSTDVRAHEEFAARMRTETMPEGQNLSGVFAADLTYAEIKLLNAQQVMAFRDHSKDQGIPVASLRDVLRFARPLVESGTVLGVYIETKQPTWHEDIGLPLEQPLLDVLDAEGWFQLPAGAIVLQSFEPQSLRKLHAMMRGRGLPPTNLTWLMDCADLPPSDQDLGAFAEYGTFIGPDKVMVAELEDASECGTPKGCGSPGAFCTGRLAQPPSGMPASSLVARAHAHGLGVHTYTHRNEGMFMALDFRSDPAAELSHFAGTDGIGIDGLFVDCPATAVAWRHLEYEETATPNAQSDWTTCRDSEVFAVAMVVLGAVIAWASSSYLVPCINNARHTIVTKYHRMDDAVPARTVQMTSNS